ncbi:hypothetical protein FZC33_25205 [Labrys sp. KNU-23]|uniref:hypothetical protein n=1 Tax=Labrys sp. KNU-23 TaxID=2789216 RepID=UPI0011ED2414|nr:hypothetical protein [Labrys sp. KNU-23]QEN89402.1 hypothetical protein FZC33_25205 [Labrys sp. KNU-23]
MSHPFLCIAIPHVERPQNYLLQTLRSLVSDLSLGKIVIAIGDFGLEPSRNLDIVTEEFSQHIVAGHLVLQRFGAGPAPLEGLARNFGDDETRVKWRSKQVLDAAAMMSANADRAPYYLHLEDDVLPPTDYLARAAWHIAAAPPNWFSIKLSPLGACAILFRSTSLARLSAYLRTVYDEMPLDWLIDEFIAFKRKVGQPSYVEDILFQHIGMYSTLPGQIREPL